MLPSLNVFRHHPGESEAQGEVLAPVVDLELGSGAARGGGCGRNGISEEHALPSAGTQPSDDGAPAEEAVEAPAEDVVREHESHRGKGVDAEVDSSWHKMHACPGHPTLVSEILEGQTDPDSEVVFNKHEAYLREPKS